MREDEVDIEVVGSEKVFGEELARKISGSFFSLDKKRSLSRVVLKKGEGFVQIDIVSFKENMIKENLLLRDFTVNSLAVKLKDIFKKKRVSVIDSSEGIEGIQNRMIRIKGIQILDADPLRLLRGIKFLTSGFHLENQTEKFIKAKAYLIKTVFPKRRKEEMFEIFLSHESNYFIKKLYSLSLLEFLFPEIESFWRNLREVQEARGSGIVIDRDEVLKYIEKIFSIGQSR